MYLMLTKKKKNEARKVKSKSQDCCVTFKPKNLKSCFLRMPAQTSQANMLHLDQKVAKCMTWNGFVLSFSSL